VVTCLMNRISTEATARELLHIVVTYNVESGQVDYRMRNYYGLFVLVKWERPHRFRIVTGCVRRHRLQQP
jgi:hypothetical protein